ncbi:MAG: response regulator [Caulobacteraceae bacterium]|nr:response regulator [Caulobacteraceae bacterium]
MNKPNLLLVEDDCIILMVLEDFLAEAGFAVTTAIDGNQALGLLEQSCEDFAAVLTDIRLGAGPDGWRVANHTRQLRPDLPVVYMSGDSAHLWAERGVCDSLMLAKPFEPQTLVQTVVGMLGVGGRLAG